MEVEDPVCMFRTGMVTSSDIIILLKNNVIARTW